MTSSQHTSRTALVGIAMYLAAAFLFALNGTLAKAALNAGLDPGHLTQVRNAGAALVLIIYVAIFRPAGFRVARNEWWFLIVYGVVAFTCVQFLYFLTISRLPVGIGTLLAFVAPVVVALYLKFFRGTEVGARIWTGIALTIAGLALVAQVWHGLTLDPLGVLAGFGLAIALATYWILGERGQQKRDAVSLTMWGFIFASIAWAVVLPWWGFPREVMFVYPDELSGGLPSVPIWMLMTWGIVMGTVVPFLLVLGSLRRIGAQRAGIVGTTEPLWAGLIALVVIGETFTTVQGVGALVVLAGVIVAETSRRNVDPDAVDLSPSRVDLP